MARVLGIFLVLLAVGSAKATDIDYFSGLEWVEPAPGQEIRLLAIYPPELPANLEMASYRYLTPKEDSLTRHGALLVHAMGIDGEWLQEQMVSSGQAIVMPVFEHNPERLAYLKGVETAARENKLGLWANGPDFLHCADYARNAFDSFAIIQGPLVDAARVRGTVYLNFGEDWRTDFTAKITSRNFRKLPQDLQNTLDQLIDSDKPDTVIEAIIEARGWVYFEGGPMIEIKEAAQLDFYQPASPFIKGGCQG